MGVGMHHGRRRGCWSAVCFHIFRRNCLSLRAEVEDEGVRSLRRRRGEDTEEEGRKGWGGQTCDLISTLSLQEVEQHTGAPAPSHTAPHATS